MKEVVTGGAGGASGAFNIGSASRIGMNDLSRDLAAKVGGDPGVRRGPPRPRDSLADIRAATASFGFSPSVSLAEGLGEYVAWARAEIGA